MTSGRNSPLASELLGSGEIEKVIEAARERFDLVLVDNPPVLPVADAIIVGTHCDGTIGVLRAGRTSRKALRRFVQTLARNHIHILGLVIEAVDMSATEYRSVYGYNVQSYYGEERRVVFSRGLLLLLGVSLQLAMMAVPGNAQAAGSAISSLQLPGKLGFLLRQGRNRTSQGQGPVIVPKDISELRIEPGDLLSVNVYDTPEFTNSYRVDPAGDLTLPLCGKVNVRGLTLPEAAKRLEAALKDGQILVQPQVNVDVLQYAGQYVTVHGRSGHPGAGGADRSHHAR